MRKPPTKIKPPISVERCDVESLTVHHLSWYKLHTVSYSDEVYLVPAIAWTEPNVVTDAEWKLLKEGEAYGLIDNYHGMVRIDLCFGKAEAPWFLDREEWDRLKACFNRS